MDLALKGGILIVGSLDWDKAREAWRSSRLEANNPCFVSAPIRYGRKSESRGETYTMVFSRSCALGRAKILPFTHRISTAEDLISEAEWLWAAEQKVEKPNGRVSAAWGSVALILNPRAKIPPSLIGAWATRTTKS